MAKKKQKSKKEDKAVKKSSSKMSKQERKANKKSAKKEGKKSKKERAAKTKLAASKKPKIAMITSEQRTAMIHTAAYYLAQKRSHMGGTQQDDWLKAEQEIDDLIKQTKG